MMLDAFPARSPSDDPDPDGYEPALAAALCAHPREVAEDCADVKIGVVRDCLSRRMLTAGRIDDWCRKHGAELHGFIRREDERVRAAEEAKKARLLENRAGRPTVEELKAKHGPTFGLTPGFDPVLAARGEEPGRDREAIVARRAAREREANQRSMLAEYAAKGFEPVFDAGGNVRSYQIVKAMNPALLVPVGEGQTAKLPDDGGEAW